MNATLANINDGHSNNISKTTPELQLHRLLWKTIPTHMGWCRGLARKKLDVNISLLRPASHQDRHWRNVPKQEGGQTLPCLDGRTPIKKETRQHATEWILHKNGRANPCTQQRQTTERYNPMYGNWLRQMLHMQTL